MKKFALKFASLVIVIGVALMMISTANARTVVYIANADSRELTVLELDEKDGTLRFIEKVPVSGEVMPLAISPNRKYLYASLRSKSFLVSSFAINPESGKLSALTTSPLADDMAYISTDRTGRYLFGASYSGHKVSVNALDVNGKVSTQPIAIVPTGQNAHCILSDLSNRYVFVTNLGSDAIMQFRFDAANGKITPNEPAAVKTTIGAGPRHLAFHPNRRWMFCVNELDGTLDTYRLSDTGTLTRHDSHSLMPSGPKVKPWAADIHLTPDGKFLYASERTTNTLAAFRFDGEGGKLSLIGHYPTEIQPRGFAIDPTGKYLLAVGQKSNGLTTYSIDARSGALRRLSSLEVGRNPNWVEIIMLPE
jgi:6-phosphogluconolactonase